VRNGATPAARDEGSRFAYQGAPHGLQASRHGAGLAGDGSTGRTCSRSCARGSRSSTGVQNATNQGRPLRQDSMKRARSDVVTGMLTAVGSAPTRPYHESPSPTATKVSVAVGYLRAFVTLMVLAQHAMLAYHPFAPVPEASLATEPRSWLAFPIADSQRSSAFLVVMTFNDIFGMSLMFFLSGLFVWQSLERNGSGAFLRRRVVRLGVPFVVAATVLTPLAYYPSYLVRSTTPSFAGFRDEWLAMGMWPGAAGPAWFLW